MECHWWTYCGNVSNWWLQHQADICSGVEVSILL
jgi:hypothetical protein